MNSHNYQHKFLLINYYLYLLLDVLKMEDFRMTLTFNIVFTNFYLNILWINLILKI